jgi:hypothetical protein
MRVLNVMLLYRCAAFLIKPQILASWEGRGRAGDRIYDGVKNTHNLRHFWSLKTLIFKYNLIQRVHMLL